MLFPEKGTPEFDEISKRVDRRIMDIVTNVAVRRKDLPYQVHALIYDEATEERFGSFVAVQYIGKSGLAKITRTSIGRVAPGVSSLGIVDTLLKVNPGTPLVCDEKIAGEISQSSIPWVEEGHYRLEGRSGGVLEVYTPYQAVQMPKETLPRGVASCQIYTE